MSNREIVIPLHKPALDEFLFFLLCGAVLSVPLTLFIEQFAVPLLGGLPEIAATLISVTIFAPFIEELSKVFPLYYRHGETQRSIFKLAICVGLGFGIVEFFTYVFAVGASPVQRIPGLIFHPASASIAAFGIATKKPVPYYFAAVALHFANNLLAELNPFELVPTSLIIVAIAVFYSWRLYDKTKEQFVNQMPLPAQCIRCEDQKKQEV